MCVTDRHDMTLAVEAGLNLNPTNQLIQILLLVEVNFLFSLLQNKNYYIKLV